MRTRYSFLDIDGTLAMPGEQVSELNKKAIKMAQNNGHKVFINTGRSDKDIPDHIKEIDFDGLVCSAGGKIYINDKLVAERTLPHEQLNEIVSVLKDLDLHYIIEAKNENYSNRSGFYDEDKIDKEHASSELLRIINMDKEIGVHPPISIEEYDNDPAYKVNFRIYEDEERIKKKLVDRLGKDYFVCIFENDFPGMEFTVGEITLKSTNKGNAIKDVCKYYNAEDEETIAFGDSMNDAAMIKEADLGIAMFNSVPELKEISNYVCECSRSRLILLYFRIL